MADGDIQVNISTNAEQIDQRIKKLTQSVKNLEAQNRRADKNISSNKARVQAIDNELNAEKRLTKARERKLAGLRQERASLQRSIGGYKAQINIRERSVQALKQEIVTTREYGNALDTIGRPALRYALYDLSNNLRRVATVSAALAVAPIGVAIAYEREFANVQRTNELTGDSIEELRGQLRDIAQSTPISWEDVTDIGALAGQLGIAEDLIAGFTENVAKFAATTDLTVDAAATGFGRLNQLIDGVDGQFEELGSAILAVGVDSVATESQIVNVSTNIASMGNLAQLSASDIVGLSGAIASLGIRPELARGNITRFFSRINRAVAEGGFALEEFSRLSGRTAEEFTSAWGTDQSIEIVLDFFDGLAQESGNAERALRDLGITSVRDIPALLRLAQSSDEVRRLVGLSNEEFEAGTKINEQYAVIAGTTAEELRRLGQNFQTLLSNVGAAGEGLAPFFASLSNIVAGISDFAATDLGQVLSGVAIGLAAVVAVATGLLSILGTLIAGVSALVFASRTLGVDLSIVGLRALTTSAGLQSLGLGALTANKSFMTLARTVSLGVKAFGIIGAAVTVAGIAFSSYNQRLQQAEAITQNLLSDQEGLRRALDADAESFAAYAKNAEDGADAIALVSAAQEETEKTAVKLRDFYEGSVKTSEDLAEARRREVAEQERQSDAAQRFFGVQNAANESGEISIKVLERQAQAAKEAGEEYLVLGDNIALYLRRQASENPELQAAIQIEPLRLGINEEFGSFANLTELAISDAEAAATRLDEVFNELRKPFRFKFTIGDDAELQQQLYDAELALEAYLDTANPENLRDLIQAQESLNEGLEEAEEKAALAAGEIQGLLDELFGAANASEKASDAVRSFFNDINEGADTADIATDSLQEMVASIAGNEFRTPRERIADLNVVLGELEARGLGTSEFGNIVRDAMVRIAFAAGFLDTELEGLPGSFASTNTQMSLFVQNVGPLAGLVGALSGESLEAGDGLDSLGGSAGGAAEEVKTLAEEFEELLDTIFDSVNTAQDQAEAVADLGASYAELGENAFFASDEIEDAVRSITDNAESPEQAVANLEALFGQLARTVGSDTDPSLQFLRNTINRVAAEFGIAASEVSEFANIDLSFFQAGVESVKEEVRTLLDYAGDLDDVISRAFDIRFSDILAVDRIADAWDDLATRIDEATQSIEDLKRAQQDLSADRAIKEYFLSVAESYGDMLRAAELRDEIAELDSRQAENARELRQQQLIAGGDLSGDEPASRESRQALIDLVGDYQDYIVTLAESGASQDELREATAKARAEFVEQARELGFQEEVVLQYAEAFDDVTTAINEVPRDITVDANVDPALQALNELNAKLEDSIDLAEKLNRVTGSGGGGGDDDNDSPGEDPAPSSNEPIQGLPGRPNTPTDSSGNPTLGSIVRDPSVVQISNPRQVDLGDDRFKIDSPDTRFRFSDGGFTGRGGKFDPAGIVHKGEFVVPKQFVNQSTGLPDPSFLAQLQNGLRGFAQGGFVGAPAGGASDGVMMVELSPFDRKLLSDAGNVQLRVNGRVVAEATNDSNRNQARRGAS